MIKVTNNMGATIELNEKELEIVALIYSEGEYKMRDGDYEKAETRIAERWLAYWNIFWGTMSPIESLLILPELLAQWEDTKQGNKILDILFWKEEKTKDCLYCEDKKPSTHFECEECWVWMCDDCYDHMVEHTEHYHQIGDSCEDEQYNILSKHFWWDSPDYICNTCLSNILENNKKTWQD